MTTPTTGTTANVERHHNLFSWLKHIKEHHHHDNKSTSISTATTTTAASQHDQAHTKNGLYTTPSEDDRTIDSGRSSSESDNKENTKRSSRIFPPPPPAIHFHRPHGLLEKFYSHAHHNISHSKHNNASNESIHDRKPSSSLSINNDADDEHEADHLSVQSNSLKYLPPYLIDKLVDSSTSINSFLSTTSSNKGGREGSLLPSDLDSPEIGYKKLKKDGNLVDYDDISVLAEEVQYGNDREIEVQAHSRSVIRNDLIRLALNGPFQSPLVTEDHQKKLILHVGCGSGNWGVDLATLFPNWLIIGMDDKSGGPVQDQRKVPRNFKYIRCYYDLLTTLHDVPDNSFDLIFARFLIFSYGEESYKELIKQCERICKPGGYVEFYELDMRIYGNPKVGPMTHKLNAKVFRVMESHGLNPRLARKLGDMISDTFHTHNKEPLKQNKNKKLFDTNYTSLPLGVWGGRLGVLFRDDINDLYEYFKINQDELDSDDIRQDDTPLPGAENQDDDAPFYKDIETMDEELETQKAFMNLHYVYARKCPSCGHEDEQQQQ